MTQLPQKELTELVRVRDRMYGLLQERRALGAFDANSGTIVALLEGQLAVMNYIIAASTPPKSKS